MAITVDPDVRATALPVEPTRPTKRVRVGDHRAADVNRAVRILLDAGPVAVMTHVRTDGDGLSAWALAAVLKKLAKPVQVFLDLPPELSWLAPSDPELAPAARLDPEAIVVTVDSANYARNAWPTPYREEVRRLVADGGEAAVPLARFDALRPVTLVLDHHGTNRGYGRWNWIEPERSAVAEMMLELVLVLQERTGRDDLLDAETARWLMVGLVTSTDWFRHHTGARTWQAAAFLDRIEGVDKTAFADGLMRVSLNYFRMAGALRMRTRVRRGVASATIPRALLRAYNVTDSEAARYIEEMTVVPASVYVLAIELADDSIRVRLRSRGMAVDDLAARFGGGGHETASGTVVGSWTDVRRLVRAAEQAATVGQS